MAFSVVPVSGGKYTTDAEALVRPGRYQWSFYKVQRHAEPKPDSFG